MPVPNTNSAMLRVKDICNHYRVGSTYVYELIAAGVLDARKAGRSTLITRASVDAWLKSLQPAAIHYQRRPAVQQQHQQQAA